MAILTVDDSTTIRRIVKRSIEEMKLEVLEAADGATALKILEENMSKVNLVILDWNMPGMSGLEVLKAIRGNPLCKDIVVMMLTSEADQAFVTDALRAGARNYLTKPFDAKMLNLKIQESLAMAAKS